MFFLCTVFFSLFRFSCASFRNALRNRKSARKKKILKWLRESFVSLKPGVEMLHWSAEVISSLLQLYPRGPAWQLEERSSPWLRPHRTPPPRLWLASSYSFSSRLFSRRTPLSQRPRPHPRWTPWPIRSAQRKNTQRFPSEVSDHLQPHILYQSVLYLQCCFYMDTFCWDNAVCSFCKISIFIQLPGNLISCFFFCDSLFSNFRFITISFFNKRIWNKGNMKG